MVFWKWKRISRAPGTKGVGFVTFFFAIPPVMLCKQAQHTEVDRLTGDAVQLQFVAESVRRPLRHPNQLVQDLQDFANK